MNKSAKSEMLFAFAENKEKMKGIYYMEKIIINTPNKLTAIETEIKQLKRKTALGIIEIGDRLLEAKQLVPFGEWESWLQNNVELSLRTARNFMRIASTFTDKERQALADFEITKLYYLVELPEDKRNELLVSTDVRSMTTRELKDLISEERLRCAVKEHSAIIREIVEVSRRIIQSDDAQLIAWWLNNGLMPIAQGLAELVIDIEVRIGELLTQEKHKRIS